MSCNADGYIDPSDRVVRKLYHPNNVLVPVDSGPSLYRAAKKIQRIGLEAFISECKERQKNFNST